MKKLGLLSFVILIAFFSEKLFSMEITNSKDLKISDRYRYAQPVIFLERGIEFMIFPDGSFDFADTNLLISRDMRINRRTIPVDARAIPGSSRKLKFVRRSPRTDIAYNRFGEINYINDVYIYYDRNGRVTSIGTVDIGYQRGNNWIRYVGNLKVNYNHWGEIVHIKGHVNDYNKNLNQSLGHNRYEYFDCDDYDDDYYYYKKDGKRLKHKKRRKNSRK